MLAVAAADHEDTASQPPAWESGLSLLGLVGILDPPRNASEPTITACKRAGIIPVQITGDHPMTARAVADRLGIATQGEPLLIAVGTALSLQAAGVYLPPLQDLPGTEPLSPTDLVIACALSGLGHVVMRLRTRLRPERQPRGGPPAARDVIERTATR
ncbi:hypothetical protein ACF05L_20735 [Streptomyces bobili]|uniref:hypothetical protein n=1 Tax=Streptomyces bobili TaxID=67280 RepID=UPI0036F4D3A6